MSKEIIAAVRELEEAKGIDGEVLLTALEDALLAAYKKTPRAADHARVVLDRDSGDIHVHAILLDEEAFRAHPGVRYPDPEELEAESDEATPEVGENGEPSEPVEPEPIIDWSQFSADQVEVSDVMQGDFGRIAAQTAKQVILQRIREAEREMMFAKYQGRVGDVVTGIVQQSDSRYTLVDLGGVEALLPGSEQVPGERYEHGARIKAVIIEVRSGTKGPQIVLSRRSEELIRELFELEVPEIESGHVLIRAVAREAGYRAKIAVESRAQGVDPVGACVGPRGSRVRMVVAELRGEKIDIIPWNDEPARFVAKALAPARVREVLVDDENEQATVIVPDDQLSLAIGREGQNARLATRLTGWRIDIKSESEFAEEEAEIAFSGGDTDDVLGGRCAAVMASGKRCPNNALPGSRFCDLPAHQAMAEAEV
jgi:transcription termination/antitermination protein NusA